MAKLKTATGSIRAKAGLPPKAGKRRPPNLESYRDKDDKRHWRTAGSKA